MRSGGRVASWNVVFYLTGVETIQVRMARRVKVKHVIKMILLAPARLSQVGGAWGAWGAYRQDRRAAATATTTAAAAAATQEITFAVGERPRLSLYLGKFLEIIDAEMGEMLRQSRSTNVGGMLEMPTEIGRL